MIELADTVSLRTPGLETLIARGDKISAPAATCEPGLIALFGFDPATVSPNAAIYAEGEGLDAGTEFWLHADPVCLTPTTAQLTLSELPENALTLEEARALSATLMTHFATDDYALFVPHAQRWYLRMQEAPDLKTLSPAACAGLLQESDLPAGRDAAHWKRMITEAQMLLHAHPVNEAREAQGKATANAIWPWGGGRLPAIAQRARYRSVWSDDLLVRGLARASGLSTQPLPADAGTLLAQERGNDDVLVVQRASDRITGATHDDAWGGALRTALETGRITQLSILVYGVRKPLARRIERRHLGRWWRHTRALHAYG